MLKKNIYLSLIIASIYSTSIARPIDFIDSDVSVTSSIALSSPLGDWYNQIYKFPSNATNWGDWSDWTFCPVDMYVSGFKIKVEGNQGGNRDDTALNRVSLVCQTKDKSRTVHLTPGGNQGWGRWGSTQMCPEYSYAASFNVKIEPGQGRGDDTAMNDLRLRCSDSTILYSSNPGPWGQWNGWLNGGIVHGSARGICGIQIQIEPHQGRGDDTAANNVGIAFCAR